MIYPILHLAAAAAGLVALLAARAAPRGGGYLLLAGFAILGFAWVEWLRQAVVAFPPAGSLGNYAFSFGILAVGVGGTAAGGSAKAAAPGSVAVAAVVLGGLPLVALLERA